MNMLRKILHGFLDVLAAILLLVALISSCLIHGIFDVKASERAICTDEFYEQIKADIIEGVESFGGIIEISGQDVINAIGEDNIKEYTRQYTVDFFDAAYNGKEFVPKNFNDGNLKEYIYNYILSFEPEVEETDLQEIYETVYKNVEGSVKYIPGIAQKMVPTVSKIKNTLGFVYDIEIYLYIMFALAVAINVILSYDKKYVETLYGLFGTMFCVLATVEIPLIMIIMYNVPSRLVIEESALLQFIGGVNTLVFFNTAVVIGIVFGIVAISLVAVSVLLARKKYKENLEKTVDKIS